MTEEEIKHLTIQGESETVEFKQSFSKSVIETLVAFSNTQGGTVLLGLTNDDNVKGIDINEETVQKWINKNELPPPQSSGVLCFIIT